MSFEHSSIIAYKEKQQIIKNQLNNEYNYMYKYKIALFPQRV